MQNSINLRVTAEAKFLLKHKTTIRKTAEFFGVSKSTVHYDLAYRLPKVNSRLYCKVCDLLQVNFCERYIRGGQATKLKFMVLKNELKEAI